MLLIVLSSLVIVRVLSEAPPAPPQNVHADKWLLRWTPDLEDGEVTYTVQYNSFDSDVWTNVPACVHISLNSCNVISTKAKSEHGCVLLRVRAERRGLSSTPAKACSRHGDPCTPDFSVTAGPGSLTVHLSVNHTLYKEYGNHAKHRVYYREDGQRLKQYKDAVASVTIPELQEGRRYCTQVQYLYYSRPVGLASCPQCQLIPQSNSRQTEVILSVVVFLLCLIPVTTFLLFFYRRRIKDWLRPPYRIPEDYFMEPFPEHHVFTCRPTEEHLDVITAICPAREQLRE